MGRASVNQASPLRIAELEDGQDIRSMWDRQDILVLPDRAGRRYRIGFASSQRGVEEALALRYRIFNLELGHGLNSSHLTGLDRDRFDDQMTHLILFESESENIVGTYRLQTVAKARSGEGVYSADEFDLAPLASYEPQLVECGRACIESAHRKAVTLFLLWRGIQRFIKMRGQRWAFGCCSLDSQDPVDGWRGLRLIEEKGWLRSDLRLRALPSHSCGEPPDDAKDFDGLDEFRLPRLLSAYANLGGRVISDPAIDRDFGTIDYLILVDCYRLNLASLEISG